MSLKIDTDGTITMYQGDTGEIVVNGLDDTKNYTVYLAFRDKNRSFITDELKITSNGRSSVVFFLSADLTNKFTVPKNSNYETYYYGIKVCELGANTEDTLFIADKDYGEENILIIYPKQVEGTING